MQTPGLLSTLMNSYRLQFYEKMESKVLFLYSFIIYIKDEMFVILTSIITVKVLKIGTSKNNQCYYHRIKHFFRLFQYNNTSERYS